MNDVPESHGLFMLNLEKGDSLKQCMNMITNEKWFYTLSNDFLEFIQKWISCIAKLLSKILGILKYYNLHNKTKLFDGDLMKETVLKNNQLAMESNIRNWYENSLSCTAWHAYSLILSSFFDNDPYFNETLTLKCFEKKCTLRNVSVSLHNIIYWITLFHGECEMIAYFDTGVMDTYKDWLRLYHILEPGIQCLAYIHSNIARKMTKRGKITTPDKVIVY